MMPHRLRSARRLGSVIAAIAVVAALGTTSAALSAANAAKPTIGFANPIASIPSQQSIIIGARAAANLYGFNLKVADANLSADKQVSDVSTFVAAKVAGVLTWTLNQGAADVAYKSARSAGIPVIGFSSTSKFINTVVQYDSVSTCGPMRDAAKYIADRAPGAKVFVLGGPPVESITKSVACFQAAAKAAGLNIVAKQDNTANTPAAAQQLITDALTRFPDLQATWSFNDTGGIGISAGLRAADKPIWSGTRKGIIVIGNDGDAAAVTAIKAGIYTATYDGNLALGGAMSVAILARHIQQNKPFPKLVHIPFTRVDKGNAATFVNPSKRKVAVEGACVTTGRVKVCLKG
jgi:ribose transport system substrate-binding protein